MSLLNQNKKLKKWKEVCTFPKISLHPNREEVALTLLKRLDPSVKDRLMRYPKGFTQLEYLLYMGPKFLYRKGMLVGNGWRRGFTK